MSEYEHKRVKVDVKLFGIGFILKFIYDYFDFIQHLFFIISCIFFYFGMKVPMFFFLFFECFIIWCQFKAPIIEEEKREAFTKWLDSAIVAEGGESCHFVNALLKESFEAIFPDLYSDYYCRLAESMIDGSLPDFITDLKFTCCSYGYKPPKFIQVTSDQAKAYQNEPNT